MQLLINKSDKTTDKILGVFSFAHGRQMKVIDNQIVEIYPADKDGIKKDRKNWNIKKWRKLFTTELLNSLPLSKYNDTYLIRCNPIMASYYIEKYPKDYSVILDHYASQGCINIYKGDIIDYKLIGTFKILDHYFTHQLTLEQLEYLK